MLDRHPADAFIEQVFAIVETAHFTRFQRGRQTLCRDLFIKGMLGMVALYVPAQGEIRRQR